MLVAKTVESIEQINNRIWAMGAPSPQDFLSILLVNALRPIKHVYNDIENGLSYASDLCPYGLNEIYSRIECYQTNEQRHLTAGTSSTAHLAATSHTHSSSSNARSKCSNCGKPGHTHPYCTQPGGGCEGQTVEEAKAKRLADKAAKKTSSDNVANIVMLDTARIEEVIEAAMIDADRAEFDNALLSTLDLQVGVNWADLRRSSSPNVALLADHAQTKRFVPVTDSLSWFLDTCASVHISCERSDFLSLRPLSRPHAVKGIGGSLVSTQGIGSIHLRVGKGLTLSLDNILYIPSATMRLISVASLFDSTNHYATSIKTQHPFIIPRVLLWLLARLTRTKRSIASLPLAFKLNMMLSPLFPPTNLPILLLLLLLLLPLPPLKLLLFPILCALEDDTVTESPRLRTKIWLEILDSWT
jgi:hypothetical protein